MQPIATWLVARPQNGGIGLALTFFFPLGPVLSSLVMAHLVYNNGVRVPAIQGLVATALLSTLAIVLQTSVFQVVASAAIWWLPVFVFAAMAGYWRSVPLALQVSVMIAMMATVGYFIVLGDPSEYWNEAIVMTIELARQTGLHAQADMLSQSQQLIVPQMTMLFVFTVWSFYSDFTRQGSNIRSVLRPELWSCDCGHHGRVVGWGGIDRLGVAPKLGVRGFRGVLAAGACDTSLAAV